MSAECNVSIFVFAHQDDEYSAAPWITSALRTGRVVCVYLTDGASRVPCEVRDAESIEVLRHLGVGIDSIFFPPAGMRAEDLHLTDRIEAASESLESIIATFRSQIASIYAPAYEGGHPDHDAAHLIALDCARKLGIVETSWQFSLYNSYRTPKPFFKTLSQIPATAPKQTLRHSLRAGLNYALLCKRYPSQRKTWLGLFPGAFVQRCLKRRETIVRFDTARIAGRPHDGELLYERMFGTQFTDFAKKTERIRKNITTPTS